MLFSKVTTYSIYFHLWEDGTPIHFHKLAIGSQRRFLKDVDVFLTIGYYLTFRQGQDLNWTSVNTLYLDTNKFRSEKKSYRKYFSHICNFLLPWKLGKIYNITLYILLIKMSFSETPLSSWQKKKSFISILFLFQSLWNFIWGEILII